MMAASPKLRSAPMKKKTRKPARRARPAGLPKDWQLPALVDRRTKPRPDRETPGQRARAAARRAKQK
jgi:hypothetical protein